MNITCFFLSLFHNGKRAVLMRAPENDSMLAFLYLFLKKVILRPKKKFRLFPLDFQNYVN